MRRCINGRSDRQRCRLCGLHSACCDADVRVAGRTTHYYVCEACEKPCKTVGLRPVRRLRKARKP